MRKGQIIKMILLTPILLPHIIVYVFICNATGGGGSLVQCDLSAYCGVYKVSFKTNIVRFLFCMSNYKTFRNVFYYRIGKLQYLLGYVKGVPTCEIATKNIGGGLFIEHGGSTYINALSIGKNCYINQCCTIGYSDYIHAPVVGDNVSVKVGAVVIGDVKIGNNVVVGANACVVKNVPDNCVVAGVPAHIIRKNGIRVNEDL